jgi:hypothetical protein
MTDARFATCRSCGEPFRATGYGSQCRAAPRLCLDCYLRERTFHGDHAPGVRCAWEHVERGTA